MMARFCWISRPFRLIDLLGCRILLQRVQHRQGSGSLMMWRGDAGELWSYAKTSKTKEAEPAKAKTENGTHTLFEAAFC
jgi:hypothetical protein